MGAEDCMMPHPCDIVFLDFEASSLSKASYPIEVAWTSPSGQEESHLIRPAPIWTDWSEESQAIHRISRERLMAEGRPHDMVARRMLTVLSGHLLYATAPSWDGQWLSKLLRASGLSRHALRLQDADAAHIKAIVEILQKSYTPEADSFDVAKNILAQARLEDEARGSPEHRALADARKELEIWHDVRRRASSLIEIDKPPE